MSDRGNKASSASASASSSYSVFSSVDELVAKPVYGSDGAASWQEFRNDDVYGRRVVSRGVAPVAPQKRADKLGTGFRDRSEERAHEERSRAANGDAAVGAGYSHFKKRGGDAEETLEDLSEAAPRDRPDHATYYFPAETFEGWKEDYVFTTRHRGTGYYWDGMDSLREKVRALKGLDDAPSQGTKTKKKKRRKNDEGQEPERSDAQPREQGPPQTQPQPQPPSSSSAAPSAESRDPYEQIAAAIRRRDAVYAARRQGTRVVAPRNVAGLTGTVAGAAPTTAPVAAPVATPRPSKRAAAEALAAAGWATASHPTSKRTYYYRKSTKETRWDWPLPLPEGWRSAKNADGKEYFYRRDNNNNNNGDGGGGGGGETSWEPPV